MSLRSVDTLPRRKRSIQLMGPGGPTLDAVGVLESLEKLKNKFSFWPEKSYRRPAARSKLPIMFLNGCMNYYVENCCDFHKRIQTEVDIVVLSL